LLQWLLQLLQRPGLWGDLLFRDTIFGVEIIDAARKHGVSDDSIRHAVEHALVSEEVGEEPLRRLFLGPDAAGNLLEVAAVIRTDGTLVATHAMAMRPKYRALLP